MEPVEIECGSCDSGTGFSAHYCDECGRWSFHAEKRHLLIAAGILAAATIVVIVAIVQPEIVPLIGGAAALARRAVKFALA
ncbi:MAG TPA: hypothetical protein VEC38_11545 [Candidatus Binataceae bacterium]|nr:hypothetical protein [Candidatus Binataceae bacterium]